VASSKKAITPNRGRVQKGTLRMNQRRKKEVVVPKENAVFWLDAFGRWHNEHGAFEHKKIINYFHSSIRRDADGYHLYQEREGNIVEKVYFKYEDTALFVFDLEKQEDSSEIRLILNTKDEVLLDPKALFIQNENLYMTYAGDRIKFVDRAMLKLADRLTFEHNGYRLEFGNNIYDIPVRA
jgi:hypothetical protein